MAPPNLRVTVDPASGTNVCYLPLAPASAGGVAGVKLALRLTVLSAETTTVSVERIDISFPGSAAGATSIPVNHKLDPGSAAWEWTMPPSRVLYLDAPAPPKVEIGLLCADFSDPVSVAFDLVPFPSPSGTSRLLLPFSAADLAPGERLETSAEHWAEGPHGTQLFGHDICCVGPGADGWSELKPDTDGMSNEHFRIYGKPVRAMIAGTVEAWEDDLDANALTRGDDGDYRFPDNIPGDKARGNWVGVRSGDYLIVYCHFQKGSIVAALGDPTGAAVTAGQVLGLAGNTGYANAPHTHIHCEKAPNRAPWGLAFSAVAMIEARLCGPSTPGAAWVIADEQGVPRRSTLIMPADSPTR